MQASAMGTRILKLHQCSFCMTSCWLAFLVVLCDASGSTALREGLECLSHGGHHTGSTCFCFSVVVARTGMVCRGNWMMCSVSCIGSFSTFSVLLAFRISQRCALAACHTIMHPVILFVLEVAINCHHDLLRHNVASLGQTCISVLF